MKLKNFYIFFPIVISIFFLFIMRYKYQDLFLSKYIINQRKIANLISNYIQNQTQKFLISLNNNFYPFRNKIKIIFNKFKFLEKHFSENFYKTFKFSNNESQIYGLLSNQILFGIYNSDNNSIFFSFSINQTNFEPLFKIYYLKKNLGIFIIYQSNNTHFILYKENNLFFIKENNSTNCYALDNKLLSINCTYLEENLLQFENLYEKLKYKFFKLLEKIEK